VPSHQPDDDIVTLQARAIVDLDCQVAALKQQLHDREPDVILDHIQQRDATIKAQQQRIRELEDLLGVYQRSRAVRLGSVLRHLEARWRRSAVRS